jgi:hypothetical protein
MPLTEFQKNIRIVRENSRIEPQIPHFFCDVGHGLLEAGIVAQYWANVFALDNNTKKVFNHDYGRLPNFDPT